MALWPCDVCQRRYRGPANHAYTAIVNGVFATRAKLRLDPEHLQQLRVLLSEKVLLVRIGDSEQADLSKVDMSCSWCGAKEAPYQVFANLYPRGSEELAFWGTACEPCLPIAARALQVTV